MSIISSPEPTPKAVQAATRATEWARAWDAIAAFLSANPTIAAQVGSMTGERALCSVSQIPDPGAFMASAAQACVDAGGRVELDHGGTYGGVNLWFGPAHIDVYADVDKVFTRRVVGRVDKVEYAPTFDLPGGAS